MIKTRNIMYSSNSQECHQSYPVRVTGEIYKVRLADYVQSYVHAILWQGRTYMKEILYE